MTNSLKFFVLLLFAGAATTAVFVYRELPNHALIPGAVLVGSALILMVLLGGKRRVDR